ncbi:MAG: hypothetical protein ABFS56_09425 [Pseudomonadota bacterium]
MPCGWYGVLCNYTQTTGTLTLEKPVNEFLRELAARQILGGYSLAAFYPDLGDCLLVCATEMRTAAEIERYVEHMKVLMPL